MMRWSICFLSLLLCLPGLRGEEPELLQEVVNQLVRERHLWAFTQFVREFDGHRVAVERLERYDPARGHERRWRLLKINGRAPTAAEEATWSERKNRVRKRPPKPITEYVDLSQARVREENAESISYEVPFRRSAGGLFPGDKVELTLTINKKTRAPERAQVSIDESFKIALGLAHIIDLDVDLEMPADDPSAPPDASADQPRGSGSAIVTKLGRRIEYQWSDFTRHEPAQKRT